MRFGFKSQGKYNLDFITMCKWFIESNRWKHFVFAIPVGFVFTILCVLGCASGMEFKDYQWEGKPDIVDWLCTMAGGVVGQGLQALLLYLVL